MKKIFLAAILSLIFLQVSNAQNPCGTALSPQMKQWLINYNQNRNAFPYSHSSRDIEYIPLKIHIVGKTNGTGYYRLANLWDVLCQLNEKYTDVGFHFYLYGDIQYINNDDYYVHDFSSGDAMMQENNVPGAANVYIVSDPAGYCGYYTYGEDAVTLAINCNQPGSTTMAHELGHYFSLPHPFDDVNGIAEFVNETNCTVGGDLFCDTRADFLNYRWTCPYTGSQTDANGDIYNPDPTLIMGYADDNCETRFSSEEMDAMVNKLMIDRQDLLNHPLPSTAAIVDSEYLSYPADEQTDVPNDWVPLKWKPVPNAEFYHLEVTRAPNFSGEPTDIDVLVSGTAYTTTLLADKKYHWRVRPLSDAYTCTTWSQTGTFYTVVGTGVPEVNASADAFSMYPTLTNAGSLLHFSMIANENEASQIRFISMDGRVVKNVPIQITNGENDWSVPTNDLAAGMYLVNVVSNGKIYERKVVLSK